MREHSANRLVLKPFNYGRSPLPYEHVFIKLPTPFVSDVIYKCPYGVTLTSIGLPTGPLKKAFHDNRVSLSGSDETKSLR